MSRVETIFDWLSNILGLAGGIPAITEKISKIWGHVPDDMKEQFKQRMPGFMGLSLDDEQIFNALVGKLSIPKQKLLMSFLYGKCKDFQRNRFINIVGGMEVVAGTPTIMEKVFGKDGKVTKETVTAEKAGEDLRLNFLKKFTSYISNYGVDEAYDSCIAGRMVMQDPFYQKAIASWRGSVDWFEKKVLPFFQAIDFQGMRNSVGQAIGNAASSTCQGIGKVASSTNRGIGDVATAIQAKADSMPKHRGHLRGILGDTIGGFIEKNFIS
jgi:hypothetical protein